MTKPASRHARPATWMPMIVVLVTGCTLGQMGGPVDGDSTEARTVAGSSSYTLQTFPCKGHPGGSAGCREAIRAMLDLLQNQGGPVAEDQAELFVDHPSEVRWVKIPTQARTVTGGLFSTDRIEINVDAADIMSSGTEQQKIAWATFFAHELDHRLRYSKQNGTAWGEVAAYMRTYEILRELGLSHSDVADACAPAHQIWDYQFVAGRSPDLWSKDGLTLINGFVGTSKRWRGWTMPSPPARYAGDDPWGDYGYDD